MKLYLDGHSLPKATMFSNINYSNTAVRWAKHIRSVMAEYVWREVVEKVMKFRYGCSYVIGLRCDVLVKLIVHTDQCVLFCCLTIGWTSQYLDANANITVEITNKE